MPLRKILLTRFIQIVLGGSIGFVLVVIAYFTFYSFTLKKFIGLVSNESQFFGGLMLLIAFMLTYGIAIAGVSESVRFVALLGLGEKTDQRATYQGAFLGAPAVVMLSLLANVHWESLVATNILFKLARIIAAVITIPIDLLTRFGVPAEILMLLGTPIGAIIGYTTYKDNKQFKEINITNE